jgi:hypothetical protein
MRALIIVSAGAIAIGCFILFPPAPPHACSKQWSVPELFTGCR